MSDYTHKEMKNKIPYPRTPHDAWLTVKMTAPLIKIAKTFHATGLSLTAIGKYIGIEMLRDKAVSHHTIQKYVDPEAYARYRRNYKKAEISKEATQEYARRARERKKLIFEKELKNYQKQYNQNKK